VTTEPPCPPVAPSTTASLFLSMLSRCCFACITCSRFIYRMERKLDSLETPLVVKEVSGTPSRRVDCYLVSERSETQYRCYIPITRLPILMLANSIDYFVICLSSTGYPLRCRQEHPISKNSSCGQQHPRPCASKRFRPVKHFISPDLLV